MNFSPLPSVYFIFILNQVPAPLQGLEASLTISVAKGEFFRKISELYFDSKKKRKDTCGFEAQYPFGFLNFIFGLHII